MTKDEALKLALEALESGVTTQNSRLNWIEYDSELVEQAITAIKEALAQPEQEPVPVKRMMGWVEGLKRQSDNGRYMHIPSGLNSGTCWELANELEQFINTTPPQRTWVGLTPDELNAIFDGMKTWSSFQITDVYFAIEAKLKEKNT